MTLSKPTAFALLIAATLASLDARLGSQSMTVTTTGGEVRVQAPGFRFITGEPLARLKGGLTVRVELDAPLTGGPHTVGLVLGTRIPYLVSPSGDAAVIVDRARAEVTG